MTDESNARMITTSSGARQYQTILHWQHPYGPAHSLLRLHLPEAGSSLAIVSEIRSNSDERGIGLGFRFVADAVLEAVPSDVDIDPTAVIWVAHYGEFSSYDAYAAPEDFDRVMLDWDGARYLGDLDRHHILRRHDSEALLAGVTLAPVPEVLGDLGWPY